MRGKLYCLLLLTAIVLSAAAIGTSSGPVLDTSAQLTLQEASNPGQLLTESEAEIQVCLALPPSAESNPQMLLAQRPKPDFCGKFSCPTGNPAACPPPCSFCNLGLCQLAP